MMPKAVLPEAAPISPPIVSRPITISSASEDSDSSQLVIVALFSGIGLLISLVAVILGVQGAWF
jgi:hypothetical protein